MQCSMPAYARLVDRHAGSAGGRPPAAFPSASPWWRAGNGCPVRRPGKWLCGYGSWEERGFRGGQRSVSEQQAVGATASRLNSRLRPVLAMEVHGYNVLETISRHSIERNTSIVRPASSVMQTTLTNTLLRSADGGLTAAAVTAPDNASNRHGSSYRLAPQRRSTRHARMERRGRRLRPPADDRRARSARQPPVFTDCLERSGLLAAKRGISRATYQSLTAHLYARPADHGL